MRGLLKAFFYLLLILVALAGALYIGDFVLDDPGFVIISYQGKAIRTSFAIFVIAMVLVLVIGYVLLRLLISTLTAHRAVGRWQRDRGRVRARKALWQGLVDLAAGDWERAERSLAHNARNSDMALLHYLGAARAAQAQSAIERRDAYLRLAHEVEPDARAAVGLTRAEMQLGQGQIEQARATLADLLEHEPGNRRALRMLYEILRQSGEWGALQGLMPRLRKRGVLDSAELGTLEQQVYRGLLAAPDSDPTGMWNQIPRRYRTEPAFLLSYVEGLVAEDRIADAEQALRKAIKRNFDEALVRRYGTLQAADAGEQLRAAETWLGRYGEEPTLLVALGRLSMRQELWGKARGYFAKAVEQEPDAEVYALLVECLNQLGEHEAAGACSQQALARLVAADRGVAPWTPAGAAAPAEPAQPDDAVIEAQAEVTEAEVAGATADAGADTPAEPDPPAARSN